MEPGHLLLILQLTLRSFGAYNLYAKTALPAVR